MDCKSSGNPCDSCTSVDPCYGVIDIEDIQAEIKVLRQRTKDLEHKLSETSSVPATSIGLERAFPRLRSSLWFDNAESPQLSAQYIERYFNYGLTTDELGGSRPIIGIAQSGSDLAPCNRHHLELAKRVRDGIREAGATSLEFPTHPIQESSRRPSASLDRNLAYLGLVELLHGYPLDGVVLLTGCDKTTPAFLMAAATVNLPAICLNVGPMLNGQAARSTERIGAGTIVWTARDLHAAGKVDIASHVNMITAGTPSVGHCNTMGTASTMNALAEALGMALPGSSTIPAAYRERAQCAFKTGQQIVEMVFQDRKPSDILTREAFENAIVANSAIGGSSNAPIHLNAIAKHIGVPLNMDDWDRIGFEIPLLLNVQPAGEMLCEEYHRAGGLPAVMAELLDHGKLHGNALTCNGRTVADNVRGKHSWDRRTIKAFSEPLMACAGFVHFTGSLFDSAILKTCVITNEFRKEFLENPDDPNAFECKAVVFDGREDFVRRIDDPTTPIDRRTILVMRGAGPLGYPGAAEVVNMQAPSRLLKEGLAYTLPCIGDGRQSGTSAQPSILNASPEAAVGGNLALLHTGDALRVDIDRRRVDILIDAEELAQRRDEIEKSGGYTVPESQTPWQELYRQEVGQLNDGMVMKKAVKFQRVVQRWPVPRDNF